MSEEFDQIMSTDFAPDRLREQLASAVSLCSLLILATWVALVVPVIVLVWRAAF